MQKNSAELLLYIYKVGIGVETGNYQWKELLLNIYQVQLIKVEIEIKEFNSYISDDNEQDAYDSHDHMSHPLKNH